VKLEVSKCLIQKFANGQVAEPVHSISDPHLDVIRRPRSSTWPLSERFHCRRCCFLFTDVAWIPLQKVLFFFTDVTWIPLQMVLFFVYRCDVDSFTEGVVLFLQT
jgi:hypothetical protein